MAAHDAWFYSMHRLFHQVGACVRNRRPQEGECRPCLLTQSDLCYEAAGV